jgi:hypothetical protein
MHNVTKFVCVYVTKFVCVYVTKFVRVYVTKFVRVYVTKFVRVLGVSILPLFLIFQFNNTWTKQVKQLSKQHQTQWSKCQRHFNVTHW